MGRLLFGLFLLIAGGIGFALLMAAAVNMLEASARDRKIREAFVRRFKWTMENGTPEEKQVVLMEAQNRKLQNLEALAAWWYLFR